MRRLVALGVAAAKLAGCPDRDKGEDAGVVDAGPLQLTEKEPNNSPREAGRIGLYHQKLVYSGPAVSVSPDDDGRIDFSRTTTSRPVRLGVAIPGGGLGYKSWNQPTRSLRPPNTMSGQGRSLVAPLYLPAALAACLPAGRLISWWWRRRIRSGFNLRPPSRPEQGTGTGSEALGPTPPPAAPAAAPASKP